MLIHGAKEEEEGTVSVRSRDTGETVSMPIEAFVEKVTTEIKNRTR
jgi:threonyl-tRNA synthetase